VLRRRPLAGNPSTEFKFNQAFARKELSNALVEPSSDFQNHSYLKNAVPAWGARSPKEVVMLRKTVVALLAVATVGMVSPTVASARGGGGGFGGGGFQDGGFNGRGFGPGLAVGAGLGYGLYGTNENSDYGYYGYPYVYYPNGFHASFDDNDRCYEIRRHVHTTHGWSLQPVQVCG
jgi:hypothetical protein